MSTYAIGDIQGCWKTLQALLEQIGFNPVKDRLWLAGDLVNRGPGSLEVLRWARDLDERITAVLGNHDIHLLAVAAGVAESRQRDTLGAVLNAPDLDALTEWLSQRPLLHRMGPYALVHAGLLPAWTIDEADAHAREAEALLRGPGAPDLLATYRDPPPPLSDDLDAVDQARFALQVFTRMRICSNEGEPNFAFSGGFDEIAKGFVPWFRAPHARPKTTTVVCGHWAALGYHREAGVASIDSACIWGGALTALRLEDLQVFHQPTLDSQKA